MQNLLLKIPYIGKKSYGGTPEPQITQQDAPCFFVFVHSAARPVLPLSL
jgi:hypothetical protein